MCSSILLKAKRTATKTARRNNRSPVVFDLICVIEQKSSFYRVCAHHFDVVFLFAMHQNRKKYASCGVKLSIIRRQILSSSDRRMGFVDAKCSNRATSPKKGETRCFRANPNGKKESDEPMIDCGALYVMSDVDGVQSEKRVVCKIKIN